MPDQPKPDPTRVGGDPKAPRRTDVDPPAPRPKPV